jgi:hypothetical protein
MLNQGTFIGKNRNKLVWLLFGRIHSVVRGFRQKSEQNHGQHSQTEYHNKEEHAQWEWQPYISPDFRMKAPEGGASGASQGSQNLLRIVLTVT